MIPENIVPVLSNLVTRPDCYSAQERKELWSAIYSTARQFLRVEKPSPYERRLTHLHKKLTREGRNRFAFVYELYERHMTAKLNEQDIIDDWIVEVTPRYKQKAPVILEDDMCGMFPSSVETVPLDYYLQAEEGHFSINDTIHDAEEMDIDIRYSRARHNDREFYQSPMVDDRAVDNGFLDNQDHRSSDISGFSDDGSLPKRRYKIRSFDDYINIHN